MEGIDHPEGAARLPLDQCCNVTWTLPVLPEGDYRVVVRTPVNEQGRTAVRRAPSMLTHRYYCGVSIAVSWRRTLAQSDCT